MSELLFSERSRRVPRSFIREILSVAGEPDVISFAGGLPHPGLFPVKGLKEAFTRLMDSGERNLFSTVPVRDIFLSGSGCVKGTKADTD